MPSRRKTEKSTKGNDHAIEPGVDHGGGSEGMVEETTHLGEREVSQAIHPEADGTDRPMSDV